MYKKRFLKLLGWVLLFLIILIFGYGIINHHVLQNEVTKWIGAGGLTALFIFCFILESAPVTIGPDAPLIGAIASGLNPLGILIVLFVSTTSSAIISFLIAKKYSHYARGFIKAKNMQKYEEMWHKHHKWGMPLAAISPIPYIPAIAGIFHMSSKYFIFVVTPIRIIKYIINVTILFFLFGLI